VRAKMEGRWQRGQSLPGLPAHLYDLFPDRLVESELGEIPEGWGVDQIGNHFRVTMGQSPPGNTYNEKGDGLPFYQGRVDFGFRFPTRRVFCTAPTRLAEAGDTLVTVRAPVGDSNMALERCCIGRGVAAVRHASGAVSYTYYFVRSLKSVFESFEAEGTVFGAITKDAFLSIKCVVPPTELVQRFEQLCRPIDEKIERAERESRTLAALRDALLPKLIRGEIRVKDAERFLKERGL
jgi:type I restriction enzyme S subunit